MAHGKLAVMEGSLAIAQAVKVCRPACDCGVPHHAADAHY